jgi:putative ABC transport system substrate-binding protein
LVGLQPDIILTNGLPATVAVQRETRTIPVVVAGVTDPVATGIVPRLDRPGGNVTGFVITTHQPPSFSTRQANADSDEALPAKTRPAN